MEIKGGDDDSSFSGNLFDGTFLSRIERRQSSPPSVIVIGGGISGIAAARILKDASFKVLLLESRDRIGGRIRTDYSFGCPIDMGASWLHGVCNENPLAPLIRRLGLTLYRTSGDNSVLYDHDLESYALFDIEGHQVPQQTVIEVGEVFKKILNETDNVRNEHSDDMSVLQAISMVLERHPELRDVSFNQLSRSIPAQKLSEKITTVDLSYNNLTGPIPASYASLPLLQKLSLANISTKTESEGRFI